MPILNQEEYEEIYEAADEHQGILAILTEGRYILDNQEENNVTKPPEEELPDNLAALDEAGIINYRSGGEKQPYFTANTLGETVLTHLEREGSKDQYITKMQNEEQIREEEYDR